jgi:hypothetical protein
LLVPEFIQEKKLPQNFGAQLFVIAEATEKKKAEMVHRE